MENSNNNSNKNSTVLIEPDEENLLGERFATAFRTKEGKINKTAPTPKVPIQKYLQLHEVFRKGTWLMDLVKFGDGWYMFFVEGNTRYLIVKEASITRLTYGAYNLPENQRIRVKTNDFRKIFREFLQQVKPKKVSCIMGDSEKVFWTDSMIHLYRDFNVIPSKVNVKREGHNKLSILDRVVRTIRDMAYQTNPNENTGASASSGSSATTYTPELIKQLAVIYNNTKHSTLTKILSYQDDIKAVSQGVSPSDMFHHPILENYFVSILNSINHARMLHTEGFYIEDGSRVLVRDDSNKRRNTYPGTWFVQKHEGQTYTVKCEETGEELSVARDKLRLFR